MRRIVYLRVAIDCDDPDFDFMSADLSDVATWAQGRLCHDDVKVEVAAYNLAGGEVLRDMRRAAA